MVQLNILSLRSLEISWVMVPFIGTHHHVWRKKDDYYLTSDGEESGDQSDTPLSIRYFAKPSLPFGPEMHTSMDDQGGYTVRLYTPP